MQIALGEGWVNLDICPLGWLRNHNTLPICQVRRIYFPLHLEIHNGINCPGHISPTSVLLPIVSLTLSKWYEINFIKVKLSVWFHELKWFPERTLESPLLLWSEEDISTKLITSCSRANSVLLVNKDMIWAVPLNMLQKAMSAIHFHLSLWRHPFTHPICNVPFTHWLSYFSGKWESKTVVLVISRIFKEKRILLILNA